MRFFRLATALRFIPVLIVLISVQNDLRVHLGISIYLTDTIQLHKKIKMASRLVLPSWPIKITIIKIAS